MNLNNFTIKAQEAVARAQQLAFDGANPTIDTDHLLKALLAEDAERKFRREGCIRGADFIGERGVQQVAGIRLLALYAREDIVGDSACGADWHVALSG